VGDQLGKTRGQVTELTTIAPIKAGQLDSLRAVLAGVENNPSAVLERIGTIHYARWVIIDDGTRLLFTSNFDGTFDQYIDDFSELLAEGLDRVFGHCEGYPGARPVEPFKAYIRAHQFEAEVFYAAYPDATVRQVQRGLRVNEAFQQLLDAAQE
jgi:hypothetical protein